MAIQTWGRTAPNRFLQWVVPGLIAGLVFGMWAMVVGLFTSTLWAPPQGIAQAIGIGLPGHQFQLVPFIVGLMGHMMNSIVLGVVFIAVARALRLRDGALALGGMVYGLIVYAVLYLAVLGSALAGTSGSFLSANPTWSWILAHAMFGVALGWLSSSHALGTVGQGETDLRRVQVGGVHPV